MKVIKDTIDSSTFVYVNGPNAMLASGPNSITANKDNGVFINGAVSFTSNIENIKFGGMFRFNPVAASGVPSTGITPIPTFTIEPPINGIRNMNSVASMLSSLL